MGMGWYWRRGERHPTRGLWCVWGRKEIQRESVARGAGGGAKVCVCAVDPGLGLVNGALCNACDLAAEDEQRIASGKASVKSKE
eukprot:5661-Chlamydomonas_euryale.AAC.1